jgi:hypothetical protein
MTHERKEHTLRASTMILLNQSHSKPYDIAPISVRKRNTVPDKTVKRIIAVFFLVCSSVGVLASGQALKAQGTNKQVPANATLRDRSGDAILSDGNVLYLNGTSDCVVSWVDSRTGYFFLRTTTFNCSTTNSRSITLDFSNAIVRTPDGSGGSDSCQVNDAFGDSGELNICGPNSLPDVRIIANTMFSNTALTQGTSVSIPFSLQPDFSGTDFELDFEQAVPVNALSTTSRSLVAPSGMVAVLYKYNKHGGKISLGRYYMPFQITVQE